MLARAAPPAGADILLRARRHRVRRQSSVGRLGRKLCWVCVLHIARTTRRLLPGLIGLVAWPIWLEIVREEEARSCCKLFVVAEFEHRVPLQHLIAPRLLAALGLELGIRSGAGAGSHIFQAG